MRVCTVWALGQGASLVAAEAERWARLCLTRGRGKPRGVEWPAQQLLVQAGQHAVDVAVRVAVVAPTAESVACKLERHISMEN